MTDLVLFDPKNGGKFTPLDADTLANLPPVRQELYAAVADAAHDLERAESDLVAATDHVAECAEAVRVAEKQMPPKRSFHSLWLETFGRRPAENPAG